MDFILYRKSVEHDIIVVYTYYISDHYYCILPVIEALDSAGQSVRKNEPKWRNLFCVRMLISWELSAPILSAIFSFFTCFSAWSHFLRAFRSCYCMFWLCTVYGLSLNLQWNFCFVSKSGPKWHILNLVYNMLLSQLQYNFRKTTHEALYIETHLWLHATCYRYICTCLGISFL